MTLNSKSHKTRRSHPNSQSHASLTGSNGYQLGQRFSTRGNFASHRTFSNIWGIFDRKWSRCYWQVEIRDAVNILQCTVQPSAKNDMVQRINGAKVEKRWVKADEIEWDQGHMEILNLLLLTDRVSGEDTTDTWTLISSEHSVFIHLPKTILPDLFHKPISNSFSNLSPRWS